MASPARRLRFSLRGMIVAATIVCLWFGKISIDARTQKLAVQQIQRLGGQVRYDWSEPQEVGGRIVYPQGPSTPAWLRSTLGDDYFQTVVSVYCRDRPFDTSVLRQLPHLKGILLFQCNVSDLAPLAALDDLERLHVPDNRIKDIGPLANLKNLQMLSLKNNAIEDCTPLHGLINLKQLEIHYNPISQSQIDSLVKALPDTAKTWTRPKEQKRQTDLSELH